MLHQHENKRGPGRPRKDPVAYDCEVVKDFVNRLFTLEREVRVLRQDIKDLKDEFKGKIDQKLIGKVIRLTKVKVDLDKEEASKDTVEEIEQMVRDKVNMVIG